MAQTNWAQIRDKLLDRRAKLLRDRDWCHGRLEQLDALRRPILDRLARINQELAKIDKEVALLEASWDDIEEAYRADPEGVTHV
jgi:hypothetical protein